MLNKKGQNVAEYAILIALVVVVAVQMQTYIKRGWQGRIKDASDDFVTKLSTLPEWKDINPVPVTAAKQYEPESFSSQVTQEVIADDVDYTMEKGGKVTREITIRTKQAAGDYQKHDY